MERTERTIGVMQRAISWLPWIALLLTILGARLWLISEHGTALPIHDQWDAEAAHLFKPWLEGHLKWSDLFSAHNEHRIVLSRLLVLLLLRLNGQWDAQLEMAANTVLCGVIGLAVAAVACRFFSRRSQLYIATGIIFWLALPYAQENTLWGFQSCFYFMLLFSLGAIWGLGFHRPFSLAWWLGAISAILACFSMASGFLAAAVVLALAGIRSFRQRAWSTERMATVVLAGLVVGLGFFLQPDFQYHAALRAVSPLVWASVFGRSLAWPFSDSAPVVFLMYWPLAWLGLLYFRPRLRQKSPDERQQPQMELLLAVGIWVILQAAAVAYSRGADGTPAIASRYMDILALGALVNVGAAAVLLDTVRRRKSLILCFYFWIATVAAGAGFTSYRQASGQAGRQAYLRSEEENLRAYVATGDLKYVDGDPPPRVPYPNRARLAALLDDPAIREILPTAIRPPLPVEAEVNLENEFIRGGYPAEVINAPYEGAWGSYSARGVEARGSMESKNLAPRLSYLQIQLAGYLREGMSLDLRSVTDHKQVRFIPTTRIDASWRSGVIPTPGREVKIVARDENSNDWFAFREPREIGRYSVYAERALAKGTLLSVLGLACILIAFVQRAAATITERRNRHSGQTTASR